MGGLFDMTGFMKKNFFTEDFHIVSITVRSLIIVLDIFTKTCIFHQSTVVLSDTSRSGGLGVFFITYLYTWFLNFYKSKYS